MEQVWLRMRNLGNSNASWTYLIMLYLRAFHLFPVIFLTSCLALKADPVAIPLGKGSYASEPPSPNAQLAAFLQGPDRLDPSLGEAAYPSNDIWSFGIWSTEKEGRGFGRPYLMPLAVSADATGFGILLSNAFNSPLSKASLDTPLMVTPCTADGTSIPLPAACQRLLRIGDWSTSFRFTLNTEARVDLTMVRGMPIVWLEPSGTALGIPTAGFEVTDLEGKPFTQGANAILKTGSRTFAIYAGGQGGVENKGSSLVVPAGTALAVAALLPEHKASEWRPAAMSLPRETRVEWKYNPGKGMVDTTWTITTEKLAPDAGPSLQGWLPHCWRKAMAPGVAYVPGEFLSPRGRIKLARGDVFQLSWRVTGLLPSLPQPAADAAEAPYNPARFNELLSNYVTELTGTGPDGKSKLKYGNDTYFGAKDVLKYAQVALAAQVVDSPSKQALLDASRTVLTDWFTWTPGEKAHYWARYEKLGAFVGFAPSFNAQEFRDTHFHCGYFTHSAAIQAASEPSFAKDFGEIATLVAKQYANWDRKDKRFPFLRAFDLWAGHSFASAKGNASGDSANQESSSESMNAWAGVGLLGAALGDADMLACGLMGYAIEGEAIKEYWNNYYGWKAEQEKPGSGVETGNWPAGFKNTIVGIVSQGGNRFGTFFSGSSHHIYGIQWLPVTPSMQYVSYGDHDFGFFQFEQMRKLMKWPFDLENMSEKGGVSDWSNVFSGYLGIVDADRTCKRWEAMWQANDPTPKALGNTMSYYFMHAYRGLGVLDTGAWADQATSSVYTQRDGARTLVAWNPTLAPLTVTAYDTNGVLGTLNVPPNGLARGPVKKR
jgi:endoglucanase Acf2